MIDAKTSVVKRATDDHSANQNPASVTSGLP